MEDETNQELIEIENALKEEYAIKSEVSCDTVEPTNDSTLFKKPFGCSSLLKTHKRIHRAETQFSCLKCNKKFAQKGTLKTHERIHTGEKPFSCSQCDYNCSTSGALKTHERTHTGYKPKCAKSATRHSLEQII